MGVWGKNVFKAFRNRSGSGSETGFISNKNVDIGGN